MTDRAEKIAELLEAFRTHSRFIVTSHARPDGDAIGSVLAVAGILDQLGKITDLVLADPIPHIYRTLPGSERIRHASTVSERNEAGVPCILLECDGIKRTGLGGLEERVLINIDHHASGQNFGSINWIDASACAVGAMVYELAVAAGVTITREMATCLYTAVLSDTGAFTYGATTGETFALVHELTNLGAVPAQIARDVYFSNPESKIRILGQALTNMQREGEVAWSWITLSEMERTSAEAEDCEGIVNYLISISGVESAVFLREMDGGNQFRLSLRSKGGVDVAEIAEGLGGGGHRTASGCTLDGPLTAATRRILERLRAGLC